jgi:hypothetical protein
VAGPQSRSALGMLFLCLAAVFAGGAYATAVSGSDAAHVLIALAAGAIALWFLGLSVRAFRPR